MFFAWHHAQQVTSPQQKCGRSLGTLATSAVCQRPKKNSILFIEKQTQLTARGKHKNQLFRTRPVQPSYCSHRSSVSSKGAKALPLTKSGHGQSTEVAKSSSFSIFLTQKERPLQSKGKEVEEDSSQRSGVCNITKTFPPRKQIFGQSAEQAAISWLAGWLEMPWQS